MEGDPRQRSRLASEGELLQAINQRIDELHRTLEGELAARIEELRRELLAEIEGAVRRMAPEEGGLPTDVAIEFEAPPPEEPKRDVLSFSGEGAHVEVPNPFDDPTTFTIALWARPSAILRGGAPGLVGKPEEGEHRMPGLWLCPADNALRYDSSATTGQRYQDSIEDFFEGEAWVHVAWVKRARMYEFYKDGELIGTRPAPKAVFSIGPDYWIGRCDEPWCGQIAEVSIWSVARSQDEIMRDMGSRPAGDEPGLSGCWPFDEGSGATAGDLSDNGNNGTIVGARWESAKLEGGLPAFAAGRFD